MSPQPYIINVASLIRTGNSRPLTVEGVFDDLFVAGSAVPAAGVVQAELRLEPAASALWVRGTVSAPWEGECRRCLAPISGVVVAEVGELFEEHWTEDETWPLVQDRIDVEPILREAVLLELPLAPVCRDDCAGLCPQCGEDRNTAACSCEPVTDPRWAALHDLHDDQ